VVDVLGGADSTTEWFCLAVDETTVVVLELSPFCMGPPASDDACAPPLARSAVLIFRNLAAWRRHRPRPLSIDAVQRV
jgi:hypothetical protein